MVKKHVIMVCSVIAVVAVSSYIGFTSDVAANKINFEEVDFASMSEADMDVIAGVKQRMKAVESSAQDAE